MTVFPSLTAARTPPPVRPCCQSSPAPCTVAATQAYLADALRGRNPLQRPVYIMGEGFGAVLALQVALESRCVAGSVQTGRCERGGTAVAA